MNRNNVLAVIKDKAVIILTTGICFFMLHVYKLPCKDSSILASSNLSSADEFSFKSLNITNDDNYKSITGNILKVSAIKNDSNILPYMRTNIACTTI